MEYDEICSLIINEMDNLIYISDVDKYELIYMNKTARESFNIDEKEPDPGPGKRHLSGERRLGGLPHH